MGFIKDTYRNAKEYFDVKSGAFFGGLSGIGVGLINSGKGLEYMLSSGGKEALKVFACGSLNLGLCKQLSTKTKNLALAYLLAVSIPSAIGTAESYAVHKYISGTPRPIASTLPTAVLTPVFFLGFAHREIKKRKSQ
jgi:hypothetical protein